MTHRPVWLFCLLAILTCGCVSKSSKLSPTEAFSRTGNNTREAVQNEAASVPQESFDPAMKEITASQKGRLAYLAVMDAAIRDFARSHDRGPQSIKELSDAGFIFFEPESPEAEALVQELTGTLHERSAAYVEEAQVAKDRWFPEDQRLLALEQREQIARDDPAPLVADHGYFFRSKNLTDRRLNSFGAQVEALFIRWFMFHDAPPSSLAELLKEFGLRKSGYAWRTTFEPSIIGKPWAIVRWNSDEDMMRLELNPGLLKPLVREIRFKGSKGSISTSDHQLTRESLAASYEVFAIVTVLGTVPTPLSPPDLAREEVAHGSKDSLGGIGAE